MPLEFETVDVKFLQGQDQRTQRKLVMAGKWDTLLNYSLSKDNTPVRRDGASVLLTANANGLIQRNDELCMILSGSMSTISATGTPVAQTVPGEVPYVDLSKVEIDSSSGYHDSVDVAYGNGFACYVWIDRNESGVVLGARCTVLDVASGARTIGSQLIGLGLDATVFSPRVVFADNAFFIFNGSTTAGNLIACSVVATSAPTVLGAGVAVLGGGLPAAQNFDVCPIGTGVLVAFVTTGGAASVDVATVTRVGTVPTASSGPNTIFTNAFMARGTVAGLGLTQLSTNLAGVFALSIAGGNIILNGATSDQTAAFVTPQAALDTVADAAAFSQCHVCATVSGSSFVVYYDQYNQYNAVSFSPLRQVKCSSVLGGIVASTPISSATFDSNIARAQGPQGPFIAGKAFAVNSSVFLPVQILENVQSTAVPTTAASGCANNSEQCSWYLLDMTNAVNGTTPAFNVVASALYGVMGFNYTSTTNAPPCQTPCSIAGPTTSAGYIFGIQEKGRLQLVNGFNFFTSVGLSSLTLTPRSSNGAVSVQLGESTYVAGGQLANYDGRQVIQHGFPMFPEGGRATQNASGAGLGLTVGVHQIVFVYEWTDGAGNRHQSRPSVPVSVTVVNTNDQIDCIVPTTQLPQFAGLNSNIATLTVVAYMTTTGGLAFYRVVESLTTVNPNLTTASVLATFSIGLLGAADSVISGNELLYTQPTLGNASLSNNPPGPVSALCEGQGRLWYLKADQPFQWGFSQKLAPNTGLQFNSTLGGFLPQDSGGGVAVAMMDEKTVFFGKRRIYWVGGNPPDSGGNNNGLSDPIDIQSDVGCSDARSVLGEVPEGILFKSQQGWHMLGRDLSVKYVGAGVSQFDSQTVTSAVLLQDRKEARFTMSGGVTLVYSTLLNDWSYFIYGAQTTSGYVVADAAWWPALNRYVWCSINDGVNSDKPGQFSDQVGAHAAESFFTLARTAFLKVGAMEGFQRVRRLLLTGSTTASPGALNSTLFLAVYFDDSYTSSVAYAVTAQTSTLASPTDPFPQTSQNIDYRHDIKALQKCKSIAFQFGEQANSTSASTLTGIQALALEIGRKKGVRKLPSSQTV